MTQEEALNLITSALAPESLTPLQINVFRGAWNKLSYEKIASELNHDYSYITDVGAELWKLLSQKLKIKVTKVKLHNALARYAQQEQMRNLSASLQGNRVDWGEAPDTSQFCGRQEQLNKLEQWVVQGNCRAIAIVGMGGIGKTMLVARLTQQLADKEMFDVIVWRSLRQAPPFVDFLTELMSAISPEQPLPVRLDAMIRQLLEQLRHHRCLLVLDNVEAVMQGNQLVGAYLPGYEDYGWLLQQLGAGRHQSTILLVTREIPAEIAIHQGLTSPIRLLRLKPLSSDAGKIILAAKGLTSPAEQAQVKELVKQYRGNPLALKIVASPIKELFNSNIAAFLAQNALLFPEIRELLAQQFHRLSSLERQVMYQLAIHREPVTAAQLQVDIIPPVSQVELRDALVSLDRRSLIEKIKLRTSVKPTTEIELDCVSYTPPPVVMEYVTEQVIERYHEGERSQSLCRKSHALLKVQAQDDGQDMQMRRILLPMLTKLGEAQSSSSSDLKQLLEVQLQASLPPGYLAENVLNLLRPLGVDLTFLDLSNLMICHADLRTMNLPEMNFSHVKLTNSIFNQFISDILCAAFIPDVKHPAIKHDQGMGLWIDFLVFGFDLTKIWDMQTKKCLKTLEEQRDRGWWSALPFGSGFERTRTRGVQTTIAIITLQGHRSPICSVAHDLEGRMLVSRKDGTIRLWESFIGDCVKTLIVERPDREANILGVTRLVNAQKKDVADVRRNRALAMTNWYDDR